MGRCMLLESKLPKSLWPYAIMTAAYVRNRCYQRRLKQTAYYSMTGRKPNLSNMYPFGSTCYVYDVQPKSKLDPRSKEGVLVGYDRESPSYLVYFQDTGKVVKRRNVKFIKDEPSRSSNVGWDDDDFPGDVLLPLPVKPVQVKSPVTTPDVRPRENPLNVLPVDGGNVPQLFETPLVRPAAVFRPTSVDMMVPQPEDDIFNTPVPQEPTRRYPERVRSKPKHLEDYSSYNHDVCCLSVSKFIPETYRQAMDSPDSVHWQEAMNDEMTSLEENNVFDVVTLPQGATAVGGRWVYTMKDTASDTPIYKARYVAKGYSQVEGRDYFDTFAPTPKMTSIRSIIQIAAQHDFIVHQMDVKTAYLNAPIDCPIYVVQPEGFRTSNSVWKLNKSLYGLKQSGKNWNDHIHEFFDSNNFIRSETDPCIYFKTDNDGYITIILWVDDIVLAGSSLSFIEKIKEIMKARFKMKDLGRIKQFL